MDPMKTEGGSRRDDLKSATSRQGRGSQGTYTWLRSIVSTSAGRVSSTVGALYHRVRRSSPWTQVGIGALAVTTAYALYRLRRTTGQSRRSDCSSPRPVRGILAQSASPANSPGRSQRRRTASRQHPTASTQQVSRQG